MKKRKVNLVLMLELIIILFILVPLASADILTFLGSDTNGSLANAMIAYNDFLTEAGTGTKLTFEGNDSGTYTVLVVPDVTLTSPGGNFDVFDGPVAGAFPVSGTRHIGNNYATDEILFSFNNPINAFGLFMTDLDGENVSIIFNNGLLQKFVVPDLGTNGSDAFFGFVDMSNSTSYVSVNDSGTLVTYDDVTFVPEPATIALLGLGSLVLLRRRKK
jgi:hypothetical protein